MRARNHFLFALLGLLGTSCKKIVSIVTPPPVSSLTVIDAVDGSSGFLTTFWPDSSVATFYSTGTDINYTSSNEYSIASGKTPVIIYDLSDTTIPLFSGTFNLKANNVYSLFLSGAYNPQNLPDTLLIQDNPPFHPIGDSTVGIRFVNVSPSAGTISVDIQGNAPGSEVTSLLYRGVTGFKNYPATSTIPDPSLGYVFEFRSVPNDSLLCTYTYPASSLPCFHNVSLVLAGTVAGSGIQAFEVNNY